MNISIIIPNYNGSELLKKNLPKILDSVVDYKDGKVEIIIADDASSDDSIVIINNFFAKIQSKNVSGKVVENENRKNGGFSKNINRGVAKATGDILLLINSDVRPYKNFLVPLLNHFSNQDVFAVGCMDESIENNKTILRGRGVGHWVKGFLVHGRGEVDKKNTLWVSGGSGAFRKSIWEKIGGLYEIYNPFYWEDIDLSYRAQKMGFEVRFEPVSRVVHEHSRGTIAKSFKPFHVKKTVYRNQFLFVWINATDISIVFTHILLIPYFLLTAIIDRNFELLFGFFSAIPLLLKALSLRKKNKAYFIKKDKDLQIFS